MHHERVTDALIEEVRAGVHLLEHLTGEIQGGSRLSDFLIVSIQDGAVGFYHTMRPADADRFASFARIRAVAPSVPEGHAGDHDSAMLRVARAGRMTVASITVCMNPDSSVFVALGHHGDIPRLEACAIVRMAFDALEKGYASIH